MQLQRVEVHTKTVTDIKEEILKILSVFHLLKGLFFKITDKQ